MAWQGFAGGNVTGTNSCWPFKSGTEVNAQEGGARAESVRVCDGRAARAEE